MPMTNSQARQRLLFVAHTAKLGGPGHSLTMLVKYLKRRFDVAVVLPERGTLSELLEAEGARCFVITGLKLRTVGRIYQLIKKERIDLVYGNNPSNCSRNAMIAAKLAGKPFIWHFRGMKHHWSRRQGLFLRWADEVVAVSRACADSLERFRPGRIRVVHNGVELSAFEGNRSEARRYLGKQLGLAPQARCLVSVSHVTPRKGHEHALAIMQKLAQLQLDVHLLIAGAMDRDREFAERISNSIHHLGLDDRVHLLGFRKDVHRLLRACDLFVHTAELDPHPRAVIEAMAAGLPVVGFGVDGVRETVVDGETGYLRELGDESGMVSAICRILDSPETATAMGQKGRERAESQFTAARTAQRITDIIEALLPPSAKQIDRGALGECTSP